MIDLTVDLGGLKMRTPVTTASGTFGYGSEYVGSLDYTKLGAVTAKGVRLDPWPGNPMPRHAEVLGGMVNAIGLQGPPVRLPSTGLRVSMSITIAGIVLMRASASAPLSSHAAT